MSSDRRPYAIEELAAIPQWVCWRYETRDGKPTKPLFQVTGALADTTKPETWTTYEAALEAVRAAAPDFDGLGFVVTGTPFCGVDLDHCLAWDDGRPELAPWAQMIVERLGSYTEVTPSRTGLRVWARGTVPEGRSRGGLGADGLGKLEIYSGANPARYFTVTGQKISWLEGPANTAYIEPRQAELDALFAEHFGPREGADNSLHPARPAEPVDLEDDALIDRMLESRDAERLSRLWVGDWKAAGHPSASEADLALANKLAFWCGRDVDRMTRLFRRSGLYTGREKKCERLLPKLLARAAAECREVWTPPRAHARARLHVLKTPPPSDDTASDIEIDPTDVPDTGIPVADAPPPGTTLAPYLVTFDDIVRRGDHPIAYHWPGWVPRAAVAMLVGAGEAFKSLFTLYLAMCASTGRAPFPDADPMPLAPGPVLYLTAENGLEEEGRRAGLLARGMGLAPHAVDIRFLDAAQVDSLNERRAELIASVIALRPAVIVIDSAIATANVENESDNAKVRAWLNRAVLPLARVYGCTVYLLGHSPKPPTQPGQRFTDEHVARGAGDWRNGVDILLYLRRDPSLGADAVVLRHAKCRIGRRHGPLWFSLVEDIGAKALRFVYGGEYAEATGQATTAITRAIDTIVTTLKEAYPASRYLSQLGKDSQTRRRAVDVVCGQAPWPHGPLQGRKQAVVTEDTVGNKRFLTFRPEAWPAEEPEEPVC